MEKHQFHRRAGLCNRIKGLVTLLSFEKPFSVYEPKTVLFPGKLSDFLDNKLKYHNTPEGEVITWRLKTQYPIDLRYENIPKEEIDKFMPYFNQLQWKPKIVKEVNDIIKELDLNNFMSAHIREDSDWRDSGRSTDLERYFNEIDKHIKSKIFFIVHNKEVEQAVKARYGDKVLMLPNKEYTNNCSEDLITWVKELLILSRSNEIVCHYLSTFSEVAWWLGNCKASVHRLEKKWYDKK